LPVTAELDELLRSLSHASDERAIWEGMSGFLARRNVKAYAYHSLFAFGTTGYEKPYSYRETINTSQELDCRVLDQEFERLLRENARSLIMPMFWRDWDVLNAKFQWEASENARSCNGISIPVHGPRGHSGCFSIEFADQNAVFKTFEVQTLQWACQNAHQNLCRLLAKPVAHLPQLTAREAQILTWIALGKSNADIAVILGISVHTVGTYTRSIFAKTNTNNRTSAALYGISNGLIHV